MSGSRDSDSSRNSGAFGVTRASAPSSKSRSKSKSESSNSSRNPDAFVQPLTARPPAFRRSRSSAAGSKSPSRGSGSSRGLGSGTVGSRTSSHGSGSSRMSSRTSSHGSGSSRMSSRTTSRGSGSGTVGSSSRSSGLGSRSSGSGSRSSVSRVRARAAVPEDGTLEDLAEGAQEIRIEEKVFDVDVPKKRSFMLEFFEDPTTALAPHETGRKRPEVKMDYKRYGAGVIMKASLPSVAASSLCLKYRVKDEEMFQLTDMCDGTVYVYVYHIDPIDTRESEEGVSDFTKQYNRNRTVLLGVRKAEVTEDRIQQFGRIGARVDLVVRKPVIALATRSVQLLRKIVVTKFKKSHSVHEKLLNGLWVLSADRTVLYLASAYLEGLGLVDPDNLPMQNSYDASHARFGYFSSPLGSISVKKALAVFIKHAMLLNTRYKPKLGGQYHALSAATLAEMDENETLADYLPNAAFLLKTGEDDDTVMLSLKTMEATRRTDKAKTRVLQVQEKREQFERRLYGVATPRVDDDDARERYVRAVQERRLAVLRAYRQREGKLPKKSPWTAQVVEGPANHRYEKSIRGYGLFGSTVERAKALHDKRGPEYEAIKDKQPKYTAKEWKDLVLKPRPDQPKFGRLDNERRHLARHNDD